MKIKILLVDDHRVMREGLRAVLERERNVEVVGEAQDGREALAAVAVRRPDVVVMDVGMPGLNGIEATRLIRARFPEVRVVALSTYSDKRYVLNMLEAGASGYVLKDSAFEELLRAVKAVAVGRHFLGPEIAGVVVDHQLRPSPPGAKAPRLLGPREREVLQLLAEGLTSPQIASRLSIASKTVETHRRNIMRKVGLHSVAELTKYAVREGLTSLDR